MKKRTKKVLSFGVAALMAVSALPFSALSVSASIPTKQTENGGTPYNFLLEEQGSGVQTISISKDEIAAGDVTKTLDVFIDSEEWPDRFQFIPGHYRLFPHFQRLYPQGR